MYDVVYIFRGILIGLMVSVPLGPMGVLIIQKTLQKGALAGFVAGMGAACADPTDHRGNFSDYRRIENLFR